MIKKIENLYKFRTFNNLTLDSLCNDELYFALPSTFNDPFDCNPTLEGDLTIDQLKILLLKMIENRVLKEANSSLKNLRLEGQKSKSFAEKFASTEAANTVGYLKYLASDPSNSHSPDYQEFYYLMERVKKELNFHYKYGICCFSESYLDPLLWSHYGDQHRGLCIGYSTDRIPMPVPQKVVYGEDRNLKASLLYQALIENEEQAKNDLNHNFLLRKATDWKYEKEWRLIGESGLQFSPLLFTEVTFGLRCPLSVIHVVTRMLAGRKCAVNYYKITQNSSTYALSRIELDAHASSELLPHTAISAYEEFGLVDESE